MKLIHAPETARLLEVPLKQQTARAYARNVTGHARIVTRLQAQATRQRRDLRSTLTKLAEAKRRLRLVAQSFEVPEIHIGKLEEESAVNRSVPTASIAVER